jgi:hypothetical protein
VRTVHATRYVTPLREGGSLPAIVEADDEGLYVVKFRAAGQGPKALVAEVVAGELARAAGFRVPELVTVEVGPELGRNEPDEEIRELLRASTGPNLGLDFLPGSITFDPVAGPNPSAAEASALVWFDAFVQNVDRTARNANLLVWHRQLWLIDHGASLYFQHDWDEARDPAGTSFPAVKDHVLLPWATSVAAAGAELASRLGPATVERVLAGVPDAWLSAGPSPGDPATLRAAFARHFARRLGIAPRLAEEADRARAQLV